MKRSTLKSEVALPFSTVKVEYYPAEIHTADSDVFHPGFYSTVNYSHFEVHNVRDKIGEPLEGFEAHLNLKKPVISVYGDRMGVVSDSAVYWNFWDMILDEDYGTYFGVLTEGVEKFMPFEINRTVNRTKFSSDSYQIVNVAFRYQNTSGDTCYIRLKANDEMTLRPEIVDVLYTDFPSSKWFFVGSHDLSIGCSCAEVGEGEEYQLTALVRVEFVRSTEHEAIFKPEFRIYRITNVNKSFYGNTSQLIWDLNLGDASRIEIDTSANYSWMLQTAPIESVWLEQVYDIIFNGMYLFSEDYWLSHPDQDRTIWMIRAVSDTTEVGYDDGNMDGSWSIGRRGVDHGRGSAMLFEVTPPFKLTAVKVYGKYYCNNTQDFCSALLENQTFIVFVLDSKMNLIKMKEFKYTDYFTENYSWVTIPLDVTINDTEFYILIDTNSSAPYADWYSGIRIAYDERSSPEEVRSYVFNWVKFEKPVRGDLDGDGNVTINDVTMVAYMITGKMKPDLGADFNNNGRIDIGDLAKIAYYIVGKAKL
ncbi:hypothetical protein DRP04_11240 [Archaeoglobales archaeon]|nr:MAG: hypothetical protein DRP04_11240 [Archaeoglobales archaeon]